MICKDCNIKMVYSGTRMKDDHLYTVYTCPCCTNYEWFRVDGDTSKIHLTESDNVNHPAHYTQGGIECIDALAAATAGLEGIEAVCTANAIKYLWRWKYKNGVEDIDKAIWYLNKLKSEVSDRLGKDS